VTTLPVKLTSTESPSYSSIGGTTKCQTPELVVIGLFGSKETGVRKQSTEETNHGKEEEGEVTGTNGGREGHGGGAGS
jgi:hypothetical protein